MNGAYYNEFEPEAAAMLRQLIKDGLIADGEVDERSIVDVRPEELEEFTQCHFFAGIGGWSVALRMAGWPDDRPVWTGSCPCQPFSSAGKGEGGDDDRHLWPAWYALIGKRKPAIVFGEQVSSAVSHGWLDRVFTDLEAEAYACAAAVLPACSVNAPHRRDRLWFVADNIGIRGREGSGDTSQPEPISTCGVRLADTAEQGLPERECREVHESRQEQKSERCNPDDRRLPDACIGRCSQSQERQTKQSWGTETICAGDTGVALGDAFMQGLEGHGRFINQHGETGRKTEKRYASETNFWSEYEWQQCSDGKTRRIPTAKSGIRIVDYGVQHRASLLHGFGNAIVPQIAARLIKGVM